MADAGELPEALSRGVVLPDRNWIARDTVTLVLDKDSAGWWPTHLEWEKAGRGWISAGVGSWPGLKLGRGWILAWVGSWLGLNLGLALESHACGISVFASQ